MTRTTTKKGLVKNIGLHRSANGLWFTFTVYNEDHEIVEHRRILQPRTNKKNLPLNLKLTITDDNVAVSLDEKDHNAKAS